jgi:DNA-binding NtrC family response regulator
MEDTTLRSIKTLAQVERDHILETLQACGGNKTKTADALGICLRTLRNKLKKYKE